MTDLLDILIAEDDPDDRLFIQRAFKEVNIQNELRVVEDGDELLDYLHGRGSFGLPAPKRRPGLILLDLNMPRKSGREVLRELKSDPELRSIPVVVLTTSDAVRDVNDSYDHGANAFVTKPVTLPDLVEAIRRLDAFWFDVVKLPV